MSKTAKILSVKTVNIPYVYHSTTVREDTAESKKYFQQFMNYKDYALPEIGKFSEDLKHPKWFLLSEYGLCDNNDEKITTVFLRYDVKRPLKLVVGNICSSSEGVDGYVRRYAYTYELCLFNPSECIDSKYTIIKPKKYSDNKDINSDVERITKMLS